MNHPLSTKSLLTKLALATAITFAAAGLQSARAQILWGSLHDITGDSDISLDGNYVDAAGYFNNRNNDTGVTVDVNGTDVVFNTVSYDSMADTYSAGTNISFSSVEGIGGDQPYGHSGDLSTDYYNALSGVAYVNDGGDPKTGTVTLSKLTAGDQYEVEVWQALPEGDDGNSDTTLSSGSNSVTTLGYDYVIGTFTADSTDTQTFTFTSPGVGEINAIELRDLGPASVPEPSTWALALVASLALPALVWRRRRGAA